MPKLPITGREDIRATFEKGFAMADMVCIPENIFHDGEWAILEWRDPKGLRGCGFFHIVRDQIIFQRGYWDKLSFLKLHGLNRTFDAVAPNADLPKSLTPRCRRAVDFAGDAYRGLGSDAVTSAHLVLGLLSLGQGVANHVLNKQGITFEKAEEYLAAHSAFREPFHQNGKIKIGRSFNEAMHRAEKITEDLNNTYLGTEHLLLALLEERSGPAAALFHWFKIDPSNLIQTIRHELGAA